MREYLELGQAPPGEDHAQVGSPNYYAMARLECELYIQAIRNYLGREPEGARLSWKSFPHDMGNYLEAVCYYDPENEAAVDYAFRCEAKGPMTWKEGGVEPPARGR